ncbi:hypothetical protein ACFSQD_02955 [Flavihumibacter stibioxidans]|uniref:DUF4878 domain-containing protein n=1 Tax=Flavihumibacter stibioxidans TaxID=1834163 RepID=A0ABR7MDK9_9BACT|nr:hypothetical protein [Flavihumibacter stibioxidans]MBC6493108.1 hypothetical protein [Flavihumibacter stibioxidans]
MKLNLPVLTSLSAIFTLLACSNESGFKPAEDAQDAGREFIRASLDGNMKKAEFYMLRDSVNQMIFDKWKTDFYNKLSAEERNKYQNANILPLNIENLNDSTVNYTYSNTYKNRDTTTVRIVRRNGSWLVDLTDIH